MGSSPGMGINSYPGPEPGKVFTQKLSYRGGALKDKATRTKEGEEERAEKRRKQRRKKADLRVKSWMKHPDDFE